MIELELFGFDVMRLEIKTMNSLEMITNQWTSLNHSQW